MNAVGNEVENLIHVAFSCARLKRGSEKYAMLPVFRYFVARLSFYPGKNFQNASGDGHRAEKLEFTALLEPKNGGSIIRAKCSPARSAREKAAAESEI
jgi:hypothetical protein